MFDRFTDRARQSMGLAREASRRFRHDYIGPEHMLLGLLSRDEGAAARALRRLRLAPEVLRAEVLQEMEE